MGGVRKAVILLAREEGLREIKGHREAAGPKEKEACMLW